MASGYETVMQEVYDRLTASPALISGGYGVRRSHRTAISRDEAPGAHVVDGNDEPARGSKNCGGRQGDFVVSIFVRDDDISAIDEYKREVYSRLSAAWPSGISVRPGRIAVESEVADADAVRADLHFDVSYDTADLWSLDLAV